MYNHTILQYSKVENFCGGLIFMEGHSATFCGFNKCTCEHSGTCMCIRKHAYFKFQDGQLTAKTVKIGPLKISHYNSVH